MRNQSPLPDEPAAIAALAKTSKKRKAISSEQCLIKVAIVASQGPFYEGSSTDRLKPGS
jgi:hypothetical protein